MAVAAPWQFEQLEQRYDVLLSSGKLSDCTFLVGSETTGAVQVPAHKLILGIGSPIFEAMFFGPLPEGSEPIRIPDIEPKAFMSLLQYIYTGETKFTSLDIAIGVLYGAKKYMLAKLYKQSISYIAKLLCPSTACRIYEVAKLFDEIQLINKCIQIIRSNTKEVLHHCSFKELDISTVTTVCSLDRLSIDSELDLFQAVERYAIANNFDKEEIQRPLQKIRFLSMSASQFVVGTASSNLLTDAQSFAILKNICSIYGAGPMPPGFCRTRKCRQLYSCWYELRPITCLLFVSRTNIQEALRDGLLDALQASLSGTNKKLQSHAANAVFSICTFGSASQIRVLAESPALQPYCQLLARAGTRCRHAVLALTCMLKKIEPLVKTRIIQEMHEFGVPQLLRKLLSLECGPYHEKVEQLLMQFHDHQ